jgi:hypothetical protein
LDLLLVVEELRHLEGGAAARSSLGGVPDLEGDRPVDGMARERVE